MISPLPLLLLLHLPSHRHTKEGAKAKADPLFRCCWRQRVEREGERRSLRAGNLADGLFLSPSAPSPVRRCACPRCVHASLSQRDFTRTSSG